MPSSSPRFRQTHSHCSGEWKLPPSPPFDVFPVVHAASRAPPKVICSVHGADLSAPLHPSLPSPSHRLQGCFIYVCPQAGVYGNPHAPCLVVGLCSLPTHRAVAPEVQRHPPLPRFCFCSHISPLQPLGSRLPHAH
eukprot:GGOE01005489.1.p3 GENE.GGOE01005489.1~~GGOE01005489.1.p3  ORF type:complete len:136 (-),score=0.72 GGOE01005489.1:464-871(-)